ncbi:MAG: transcriptional regulator [Rhodospirillaceae bacterium]|nr:MAG: transcriptional regulator [Rhodospirillaceae bacterium]
MESHNDTPTNGAGANFDLSSASRLLRSMSNDRRLRILLLLRSREMAVGEIAEQVELSQSALSQHLAILRTDGLVNTRRQAQSIFYSLASDKALTLLESVEQLFSLSSSGFNGDNVEHVDFRQQSRS